MDKATQAYERGRQAYRDGVSNNSNPYPSQTGMSKERVDWYNGWYDEWRVQKYGW